MKAHQLISIAAAVALIGACATEPEKPAPAPAPKAAPAPAPRAEPKPVPAKPDPQLTDKEKARLRKMTCEDFLWEWDLLRDVAKDAVATEFMPRIAVIMYAQARSEAGDVVDAKVWPASKKGLKETVDRCRDNPPQLFWQDTFKPVMDEAVPK